MRDRLILFTDAAARTILPGAKPQARRAMKLPLNSPTRQFGCRASTNTPLCAYRIAATINDLRAERLQAISQAAERAERIPLHRVR